MHQFITYHVYPASVRTDEGRAGFLRRRGGGGGSNNFRSYKCMGAYCTRGARCWRWWGWRGRRGRGVNLNLEDHKINELELPHGWLER